jgi:hypothetical protein
MFKLYLGGSGNGAYKREYKFKRVAFNGTVKKPSASVLMDGNFIDTGLYRQGKHNL